MVPATVRISRSVSVILTVTMKSMQDKNRVTRNHLFNKVSAGILTGDDGGREAVSKTE